MKNKKYNAIEKCLEILSIFSLERPSYDLKEINKILGFNLSTTYRILNTLINYGYIVRLKNKQYTIDTQALYLSAIYTRSNQLDQIRPIVDNLRDMSNETAAFFIEEDNKRICLYRAHSRDEIRHNIEQGTRLELNRGSSGRIILAYGKRKNDPSGFYKEIRDKGFFQAIDENNSSLFSIAVPVISKSSKFAGALVISGPANRFNGTKRANLIKLLKEQLKNINII